MNNNKKEKWILIGLISLMIFIMFYFSPKRLDDLTWGGSVGLERLSQWFRGYNGRYTGNIIVIIMTRLPAFIRASVELALTAGLIYVVYLLLDKDALFTSVFGLLVLIMKPGMLNQSLSWISGFSNFFTSAIYALVIMLIGKRYVIYQENMPLFIRILTILLVFFGQLILENISLFVIFLSFLYLLFYYFKKRKFSWFLFLMFITACLSFVIMFSNKAYQNAIAGNDETYKRISISGGIMNMIKDMWFIYKTKFVHMWIADHYLLNTALGITVAARNHYVLKSHSKWKYVCFLYPGLFFLIYIIAGSCNTYIRYDVLGGEKTDALIYTGYYLYLFASAVFVNQKMKINKINSVLLFSQIVLAGPLILASPINDRCFFFTYMMFTLSLIFFIKDLMAIRQISVSENTLRVLTGWTLTGVLFITILINSTQALSWKIDRLRTQIISEAIALKQEKIYIPEVPRSSMYCYGANIANDNEYWIGNFKQHYGISPETEIEFIPYSEWTEKNN